MFKKDREHNNNNYYSNHFYGPNISHILLCLDLVFFEISRLPPSNEARSLDGLGGGDLQLAGALINQPPKNEPAGDSTL